MTVREFFDVLYGGKSPEEFLVITSLDDGRPLIKFFSDLDESLYQHIAQQDQHHHVYFGVGLLDRELPNNQRGRKENIIALPGLWVDIDILGPGHKKRMLFKTEPEALDVIKSLGLQPSITVRTGGGLHLYFLFTELWRLKSAEEQDYADRVSQGFQTRILQEAKLKGAVIDMTGDITRILRCPDTVNKKNKVRCEVIETDPSRYTPDQFKQFEDDYPIKLTKPRQTKHEIVVPLNQKTVTPQLHALMMNDPDFVRSFARLDKELHESASEYDLSLASKLAWMGMPPEVLANAVVMSRNQVDNKAAKRPDYVARTVARAYVGVKTEEDAKEEDAKALVPQDLTEDERQDILKELSLRFMVKIVNVLEYTGTRHSYEVVTEHGKFDLGTTDQIMNWRQFNSAVMQLEHRTIPPMKTDRWMSTLNLMLQAVEMRDTGGSGDDENWLKSYLFEYCRSAKEYPHEGKMDYPSITTEPVVWVKGNERFIHAKNFKAWLKHETRNEEKMINSRFAARMRGIGCMPRDLPCTIRGNQSSFDAWLVPRNVWDWGGENASIEAVTTIHSNGHGRIPEDPDAAGGESPPETKEGGPEDDEPVPF